MVNLRPVYLIIIILLAVLSVAAEIFHTGNPIARAAEDYAGSVAAA